MGIAAVVILSIVALFTFSNGSSNPLSIFQRNPEQAAVKRHVEPVAYEPPARKSVIVAPDGVAYRTADGTQMTRRDRSRKMPVLQMRSESKELPPATAPAPQSPEISEPEPVAVPAVTEPTPPMESTSIVSIPRAPEMPAVVHQYQVEQLPTYTLATMSLGRKVKTTIHTDPSLSRMTRLSLRVSSAGGKVVLKGVAMDETEKARIGAMAAEIAGAENVDNRLISLSR